MIGLESLYKFDSDIVFIFGLKSRDTYDFVNSYVEILIDFTDYISDENINQVVTFKGSDIIGVRIFRILEDKIHLSYTAVREQNRNRGINKFMFRKIEVLSIEKGIGLITSNVRESNVASYTSLLNCGFVVNNEVSSTYSDGEKKINFYKVINL